MLLLMMARDTPEDKSKFEKIYSKYKDVMYYAAYGILGGQYEAEDAVSQTLFKLISHLEKIEDVDSKKTEAFIVTITEHTAIDCYRKRKRERLTEMHDEEVCSQYTEDFSEGNEVEDCINSLPVNYAVVLHMISWMNCYINICPWRKKSGWKLLKEERQRKSIYHLKDFRRKKNS